MLDASALAVLQKAKNKIIESFPIKDGTVRATDKSFGFLEVDNNESYFIVEIKSLKRIIDSINENIPVVCFIDEVLRGTNTVERIASSAYILKYISVHLDKHYQNDLFHCYHY